MTQPRAGFLLTRHWRDTPQGTELSFWLATDDGPLQVTLPPQESVAFIPEAQRAQAERLLQGEKGLRFAPLALKDFHRQPIVGLYCRAHRQLMRLEKMLRDSGVTVYEGDIRPPERYLMERFITAPVWVEGETRGSQLVNARNGCRWISKPAATASCTASVWKAAASGWSTCWAPNRKRRQMSTSSWSSSPAVPCCWKSLTPGLPNTTPTC